MVSLVSIKWEACQIRLFGSHSTSIGRTRQEGMESSSLGLTCMSPVMYSLKQPRWVGGGLVRPDVEQAREWQSVKEQTLPGEVF